MEIAKKNFLTCFLLVIAVLCFFPLAPAFADMEKLNETELAGANASVNLYYGGLNTNVMGGIITSVKMH